MKQVRFRFGVLIVLFIYSKPDSKKKKLTSYFEPNFGIFYEDSSHSQMFISSGWLEQNAKTFDLATELVLTDLTTDSNFNK